MMKLSRIRCEETEKLNIGAIPSCRGKKLDLLDFPAAESATTMTWGRKEDYNQTVQIKITSQE